MEIPGLNSLLEQFDAREILHVTFGSVLTEPSEGGGFRFRHRLMDLLAAHHGEPDEGNDALRIFFENELELLGRLVELPAIRERVRCGKPIDHLVPDAVNGYIREHGLYRDRDAG